MPRIRLSRDDSKQKHIEAVIRSHMIMNGFNVKKLAHSMDISAANVFRKLARPETFTLKDLWRMQALLRFTPGEQAMIMNGGLDNGQCSTGTTERVY